MTDVTMLRQFAIGKLMDIQEICNEAKNRYPNASAETLADEILDLIKAD